MFEEKDGINGIVLLVMIFIIGSLMIFIIGSFIWTIKNVIEKTEQEHLTQKQCEELKGQMIMGNIFKETKCVIYDNGTIKEIPEYLIQVFHQNRK